MEAQYQKKGKKTMKLLINKLMQTKNTKSQIIKKRSDSKSTN